MSERELTEESLGEDSESNPAHYFVSVVRARYHVEESTERVSVWHGNYSRSSARGTHVLEGQMS